jgi:hypothetical protein
MSTANAIGRAVREILNGLVEKDLVLLPNPTLVDGELVTWRSPTPLTRFVDFADYPTIRTYRRWGEAGEYSALLPDGALLQIRYTVADGAIASHRLAYIPCPYRIDRDMLLTDSLSDVLELHASDPHDTITMQSAIRFDFDPASAAEGHPAAHLTLNVASCRIACEAAMSPAAFVKFVYRNFYQNEWVRHSEFFGKLPEGAASSTVTENERLQPHIAWRKPT